MSGYVIEIPQEKENGSIWSRQLRVAAYCRVSTPYEEQQKSLEKQLEYFANTSREIHFGGLSLCMRTMPLDSTRRIGPDTKRC